MLSIALVLKLEPLVYKLLSVACKTQEPLALQLILTEDELWCTVSGCMCVLCVHVSTREVLAWKLSEGLSTPPSPHK